MKRLVSNEKRYAWLLSCWVVLTAWQLRGASYNISITAGGFSPSRLEVAVGETVYWWNEDASPHSTRNDAYPWSLGPIAPGYGVQLHTQKPGVFTYVDDWGLPSATLVIKAPILSQPTVLPGGYFEFTMSNLVVGETLNIEASTDLVNWTTILTHQVTLETDSFIDPIIIDRVRFYRISVVP